MSVSNDIEVYAEDIGETTEVSWRGPENMSYDRWAAIGRTLQQINRSVGWWIGDWLTHGERVYGESYAQAVEIVDTSVETLKKYAAVARRIKPEDRQVSLSWSHHFGVAYMPEEERGPLLQLAARFELSTRELKTVCDLDDESRLRLLNAAQELADDKARSFLRLLTDMRLEKSADARADARSEEEAPDNLPFTDDTPDLPPDAVQDFWVKAGFPIKRTERNMAAWPGIVVRADMDGLGNPVLVWEIHAGRLFLDKSEGLVHDATG